MRWSDADFERLSQISPGAAAAADPRFAELGTEPGNLDTDIERISRTTSPIRPEPARSAKPTRGASRSLTGSLVAALVGGRRLHRAFGPALAAVAVAVIAVATSSIDGPWNGREAIVDSFRSMMGATPETTGSGDGHHGSVHTSSPTANRPSAVQEQSSNRGTADRPPHAADGAGGPASAIAPTRPPQYLPPIATTGSAKSDQPDHHWDVRAVQHALAENGYYKGAVDGDVGPMTRRALRDFQRREGLPPTGRIDSSVVRALERQEARPLTAAGRNVAIPSR